MREGFIFLETVAGMPFDTGSSLVEAAAINQHLPAEAARRTKHAASIPLGVSCQVEHVAAWPSPHRRCARSRSHESSGETRDESRSSAKTKLDRTIRLVGKRAAGVFSGDSPSHASQSLNFLAACRRLGGLGSERHLAHREDLRLPCGQRELPVQLPSLQSYLLRPCSHTWLPLHPSRLHLYLLMPCGLQRPKPHRPMPHLQNCSGFQERGQ